MRSRVPSLITLNKNLPISAVRRGIYTGLLMLAWTGIASAGSVAYTYDALGRVIQASYSTGVVIAYVYDAAGNRTSYVISGAPS